MDISAFHSHLFHSIFFRRVTMSLITLAWSSLVFCGHPIHDAAKAYYLVMIEALLKENPNPVTPLHLAAAYDYKAS
jgi:hypothetical protein